MRMKELTEKLAGYVRAKAPHVQAVKHSSEALAKSAAGYIPLFLVEHLLWMLTEIPNLPPEKANRWLGFVQGWLTAYFGLTVDQCHADVREWVESPNAVAKALGV